jgi:hypothetical protein
MILLANSEGLVNEIWGEYGTNGTNGTNGKTPEQLSVCSVYSVGSVFSKDLSATPYEFASRIKMRAHPGEHLGFGKPRSQNRTLKRTSVPSELQLSQAGQ